MYQVLHETNFLGQIDQVPILRPGPMWTKKFEEYYTREPPLLLHCAISLGPLFFQLLAPTLDLCSATASLHNSASSIADEFGFHFTQVFLFIVRKSNFINIKMIWWYTQFPFIKNSVKSWLVRSLNFLKFDIVFVL